MFFSGIPQEKEGTGKGPKRGSCQGYQGTPLTRRYQEERKEVNKPNCRAAVTAANVMIIIFKFWHKSSFSQCWILHLIFFDVLSHPLPPFYIVKQ